MKKSIVLTVIANDQPGIINRVSGVLGVHGGNWTHSSMSHLAGRFAGILAANLPEENAQQCLDDLHALESEGIHIIARSGYVADAEETMHEYAFELVGNDRPGIVADMTRVLAAHNVSVHGLETMVEAASMAGGELFRANAHLQVPESADLDGLVTDLESMANDLMVDITFEK